MLQIRNGVFETNSSSTHSIVISKSPVRYIPDKIVFRPGEFGWENRCVDETGDYLYTGIISGPEALVEPRLNRLKELLDEFGVKYEFRKPRENKQYGYYENCYVDHAYELAGFIDAVLGDKDRLARFLFGDSCVYTGNDNQDCVPDGCNICDPYYYTYDDDDDGRWTETRHENPYYDPEHYEYFEKGN